MNDVHHEVSEFSNCCNSCSTRHGVHHERCSSRSLRVLPFAAIGTQLVMVSIVSDVHHEVSDFFQFLQLLLKPSWRPSRTMFLTKSATFPTAAKVIQPVMVVHHERCSSRSLRLFPTAAIVKLHLSWWSIMNDVHHEVSDFSNCCNCYPTRHGVHHERCSSRSLRFFNCCNCY